MYVCTCACICMSLCVHVCVRMCVCVCVCVGLMNVMVVTCACSLYGVQHVCATYMCDLALTSNNLLYISHTYHTNLLFVLCLTVLQRMGTIE